ncbi:hypothetical protein H5410_006134 [Solanum commersonii]|uniref:HTH La-type RNA-binding domain-containing protein n=1 Tax=Solanum commersonii TaxID=4109 RepID=A0A9J6A9C2_SOLCO|nr:hypothetical protein H5410_006134 [Solanum commersonii]
MGAVSWPALSDSTKASPKLSSSSSSDLLKTPSRSVSLSQDGMASASHRQAKTNNVNPDTMLNHVVPSRQRSMKPGGGNSNHNASANGVFSPQQAQGFEVEAVLNNSGKTGNSGVESLLQGIIVIGMVDDGVDLELNHMVELTTNINEMQIGGAMLVHIPWRWHISEWLREVPSVFYLPGPFPDSFRGPMFSPVPFFHVPDTQWHTRIVNQMDYYFSNENLIKDTFLRQNMDEHGWVPVTLIAGFKKVMELTDNIQLILNAVRFSTVVEVQGEKLRRRNEWFHWLLPSVQNSTVSNPQSLQKSTPDLLVENFQRVAFDDKTVTHGNAEAHLSRSSSAELSTPSEQFGNEMAGQAGGQHWQPMPVGNQVKELTVLWPQGWWLLCFLEPSMSLVFTVAVDNGVS